MKLLNARESTQGLILLLLGVTIVGCKIDETHSQFDESVETLTVTPLVSGTTPTSGIPGGKKTLIVADHDQLETTWAEYSTQEIPEIDFTKNVVIVFDRGAINLNDCDYLANEIAVTAVKHSNLGVVEVSHEFRQNCPSKDRACAAYLDEGRPFQIVQVSMLGGEQLFVGDKVFIDHCD